MNVSKKNFFEVYHENFKDGKKIKRYAWGLIRKEKSLEKTRPYLFGIRIYSKSNGSTFTQFSLLFDHFFNKMEYLIKNENINNLANKSYSQYGEDKVIVALLTYLFSRSIDAVTYLDIGSNRPDQDNNTYYFYLRNGSGVLIDPNPAFKSHTETLRPRDIFLNCGVAYDERTEATYYSFSIDGWNTFSKERAEEVMEKHSDVCSLIERKEVKLININDVLNKYFSEKPLDIMSIDVEGLDFDILSSIHFDKISRPKIICYEANRKDITYGCENKAISFMAEKGYVLVADTFINMIFADITQLKPKIKGLYYNGKCLDIGE